VGYGTIYGWRPEMIYTVFTVYTLPAIPGRYTLAESLLECLLESLFQSLLGAFWREPRIGRSRVFHSQRLADGTLRVCGSMAI